MIMYLLAVLVALVPCVLGFVPFTWSDCSPPATRAVLVTSINANPVPLVAPGPLHLSFSGKVIKPITHFVLDFEMMKHSLFGTKIRVPCVNGIGSCIHDGCSYVDSLLNSTDSTVGVVAKQIVEMVASVNASLVCPLKVENINVHDYTIHIPDLGTLAHVIGDGDYTVTVKAKIPATGDILSCLTMELSITSPKCTGFLCGLGRRR